MRRHHFRQNTQQPLRDFQLTRTPTVGGSLFDITDSDNPWTYAGNGNYADLQHQLTHFPNREYLITGVQTRANQTFYGDLVIEYSQRDININDEYNGQMIRHYFVYINNPSQLNNSNNQFTNFYELSYRTKDESRTYQENTVVTLPQPTYPRYGYVSNNYSLQESGGPSITNITMNSDKIVYALFNMTGIYAPAPPQTNEIYIGVSDRYTDEDLSSLLRDSGFYEIGLLSCARNTETNTFFVLTFDKEITYLPDNCITSDLCRYMTSISIPYSVSEISKSFVKESKEGMPYLNSFTINSIKGLEGLQSILEKDVIKDKENCIFYVPKGTMKTTYSFINENGYLMEEFSSTK